MFIGSDVPLGVAQAHELEMAMRRAGYWTPALVKQLSSRDVLRDVRDVLLGHGKISLTPFIINATERPTYRRDPITSHISNGIIEVIREGDDLYFDGKRVDLYLANGSRVASLNEYRTSLRHSGRLFNATVAGQLHHLQHLFPRSWIETLRLGRTHCPAPILFLGTLFDGGLDTDPSDAEDPLVDTLMVEDSNTFILKEVRAKAAYKDDHFVLSVA